jgi:hypothetical protein
MWVLNKREGIKGFARRLNAATRGGVVGMVAGKVKARDQVVATAAGVLFGLPLLKTEGIVIGLMGIVAIAVGSGLLIRLWKWRVGVPRDSSDY